MDNTPIDKPRADAPKRSEEEQIDFFNRSVERYREASAITGETRRYYNIGDTIVCLAFAGETLIPYLTPALRHLETEPTTNPDLVILIWDSLSTSVEMVLPPCDRANFTERGDFWGFNSKRIRTAFHWSDFSVNLMDLETKIGFYWVKTVEYLPMWVFAAPLRTLFHWWMEQQGGQLLHAAAVGTREGALLITGKGGVGKSTTALSCLRSGMYYLADDYLIVRLKPQPMVQSLYCSAKLVPEDLHKFPEFAPFLIRNETETGYDKLVLFLYPELRDRVIRELPLIGVLSPVITEETESSITKIAYTRILGAMSFTTMSQLPYSGEYTQHFITRLIEALPCYQLSLGKDTESTPKLLRQYLAGEIKPDHLTVTETDKEYRPLISIIIPVYNGAKFVREAVSNILAQQYPATEIIFVDDGSTDDSEKVISALEIDHRYFYQENQGPAIARNRGIKEATGDFIAFLDVDDLWPVNNLHHLMDEILEDESIMVVHGHAQLTEKDAVTGTYEYIGNPGESFPGFLGAGLYRRDAFNRVGTFDTLFAYTGEDADWFKRASELDFNLKKLNEVTLFVRRHGDNMTGGRTLVELNTLKVFKKSLDRIRNPFQEKLVTLDVSVIIPVFNGEKYISEAIVSVLNQAAAHKEVILVDDGSTDQTLSIAERFVPLIRIVRQENRGAAAARNTGVGESCGKYLTFLDADDLWMPGHTEVLLTAFEEHPEADVVMGELEQFVSPELGEAHAQHLRNELKVMPGFHPGCMLISRQTFDQVGPLNEKLRLAEFVDWFARAQHENLNMHQVNRIVYKRRIHTTNQGMTKRDQMQDYTAALRDKILRNRKAGKP
jgi:glycosyltransferase involved in cell wall biosynthesis